jgi:hypothetical protein
LAKTNDQTQIDVELEETKRTTALCFKINQLTVGTNIQLNCGEFKDFDFPSYYFLDFLGSQTGWIERTISHKTKTSV